MVDPVADVWTPTSLTGAPTEREAHSLVWTGEQMIVFGGTPATFPGGLYE